MDGPAPLNYPNSETNNNNEANIQKEFLIKADNITYKLKILQMINILILKLKNQII